MFLNLLGLYIVIGIVINLYKLFKEGIMLDEIFDPFCFTLIVMWFALATILWPLTLKEY